MRSSLEFSFILKPSYVLTCPSFALTTAKPQKYQVTQRSAWKRQRDGQKGITLTNRIQPIFGWGAPPSVIHWICNLNGVKSTSKSNGSKVGCRKRGILKIIQRKLNFREFLDIFIFWYASIRHILLLISELLTEAQKFLLNSQPQIRTNYLCRMTRIWTCQFHFCFQPHAPHMCQGVYMLIETIWSSLYSWTSNSFKT